MTQQTPTAPDYRAQLLDALDLPSDATDEEIAQATQTKKETAAATQHKELDQMLAGYEMPDATKSILRETLLADRGKGETLLAAMPKKPAQTERGLPPTPTHSTARNATQVTDEEKATAGNQLINEIQREGKFRDYSSAREEARRRMPHLFEGKPPKFNT
jgi:hypothetical protein